MEEYAYLAGILDGEGTIGIVETTMHRRKHPCLYVYVSVKMTNPQPLLLFNQLFGGAVGGPYKRPSDKAHWKECYNWQIQGARAGRVLTALLPFLRVKRAQAELALQFEALRAEKKGSRQHLDPVVLDQRREFRLRIKELNHA